MTSRSITASGAEDYADYLDNKTVETSRGDYYLGPDGQPAASPGRWLAAPEALAVVGIGADDRTDTRGPDHDGRGSRDVVPDEVRLGPVVAREELVALMQGVHPSTGEALRGVGRGGRRNAGVDLVFGAPKSVSVAWAIGDTAMRQAIEGAHDAAVRETFVYLRSTVPAIAPKRVPQVAAEWYAAAFLHTTSRAVKGRLPDPHIHTHVVVTSALDHDGEVRAIRDRTLYRAGREGGAYYRAALAAHLIEEGFEITAGTGNHGRYFELAGIPAELCEELSARHRELVAMEQQFQARHGRKPTEAEMSFMEVGSRARKLPHTDQELRAEWTRAATRHGVRRITDLRGPGSSVPGRDERWADRVEDTLTSERATFGGRELRAAALEQGVAKLTPKQALGGVQQLADTGRIIPLEEGRLTTRAVRWLEQYSLDLARTMVDPDGPGVSIQPAAIRDARAIVSERLGAPLSDEQERAINVLTGPQRLVALEGNAGSGKGVVLDVVARAEQQSGRTVLGVTVAGRAHHRLAEDSPTLLGNTLTAAALLSRTLTGSMELNEQTTVIVDEAGMIDTPTLAELLHVADERGSRVVLVGDRRQLEPIGPGGMLAEIVQHCPLAKVAEVHRTQDPAEQAAWAQLRRGKAAPALVHYQERGQLHLTDERQDALREAAARYDELARQHGHEQVALMTDGDDVEALNARVQHLRSQRGELGSGAIRPPRSSGVSYALHPGDRVAWRAIQRFQNEPRVENGTTGTVLHTDPRQRTITIELSGSRRTITLNARDLDSVRLGYASSVYRQQGATVDRAVALTGGWQADRAGAYVQASRARHGIDWYVSREDLGDEGSEQIDELARRMSVDRAEVASIAWAPELYPRPLVGPESNLGPEVDPSGTPLPRLPVELDPAPAPSVER